MTQRDRTAQLKFVSGLLVSGILVVVEVNFALAQSNIEPDRTLGSQRSIVQPNVILNGIPSDRISGGARRGINLFHSFREFNIDEGRGAYFTNPSGVENILSRVTGTNHSNILGTLGVLGNANLFLINPNGIIFGQNASLDVKGSFVATTANAVQFGDRGFFSATEPNAPTLLTVNPSAFLFNQIATQQPSLTVNSVEGLRVFDGQNLLLLGGNVSLDRGFLQAFGGRVELGGVTETGTVGLNIEDNNFSLSFPNNVARADVSLTNNALVDVTAGGGGSIAINARNLELSEGSGLRAGIRQGLDSARFPMPNGRLSPTEALRGSQAGDITIQATENVIIQGDR
ncbi:MAG: filamentous hemagglutinin N-terminal domain-containing protein, partial [Hydrococcus sp. RU_2_2]|nr:filamentous hemagglutinin N-terminal domain-containing protein [Hydrococcus sp. RU_2_2]